MQIACEPLSGVVQYAGDFVAGTNYGVNAARDGVVENETVEGKDGQVYGPGFGLIFHDWTGNIPPDYIPGRYRIVADWPEFVWSNPVTIPLSKLEKMTKDALVVFARTHGIDGVESEQRKDAMIRTLWGWIEGRQ